jgi:hypothetical protein
MTNFYTRIFNKNLSDDRPKLVLVLLVVFICIVIAFYSLNFYIQGSNVSNNPSDWGTFGDYVGGTLNPLIAALVFYYVAESYVLQKQELAKTTELLKVSTDAQHKQIILAALTAILNSNLTRIGLLISEKAELSAKIPKSIYASEKEEISVAVEGAYEYGYLKELYGETFETIRRVNKIDYEINQLSVKNTELEVKIDSFLK